MEVTPEVFAWLTSLNILDPFKSLAEDTMSNFIIPEKTLNLLFGGKYMDIILKNLQEAYNQFYKVKMDYVNNISQLKPIQEDEKYISNSIKYSNWLIIREILSHFGLSYSEDEINLLVNNDKEQLNKIISKIYELFTQFLKHSINDNENTINNINTVNSNSVKKTKKIILSKSNKNEQEKESNIELTNNNLNKTNNKNKYNNYNNLKFKDHTLNINELDPYKSYKECSTPLEFFILSICKNMLLKPRQSVALLSNNRKYLSIICHRGFNNDFNVINKWLTDLYNNKDIMIQLVQNSGDGPSICYGIIGKAICSKDPSISLQAAQLLNIIKYKIGTNWDWLINEGFNSFIFILAKYDNNNKLELMKLLYDFIIEDTSYFFDEIKKKLENDKKIIFEFFSNIIPIINNLNNNFCIDFQNVILDTCLKEKNDKSYSLSLLSDAFFYFNPKQEDIVNKIISYFRECIRSNSQNIFSTAVFHTFILMERFGKIRNKYAPQLYKNLVFLFLEEYDNEMKREVILEGFEKFFNNNHDIPIDILIEPYLNQLNTCQNYTLCDFLFFLKIVEHPRIEGKDINSIIQFILNVCLNNVIYSRTANLILSLIFEKKIIEKTCKNAYDINEIEFKFVDFINTALDSYITNLSKEEDKFILETPYDIMTENFTNVNMQVKDTIIKSLKVFRKLKGEYSNCLLAMLWYYKDNDDIILQIEEINRPVYEPLEIYYERKKKEQEERDKKDYTKKLINNLSKMQEKKMNILKSRQILIEQKKIREERIKKRLAERRRLARVIPGIEAPPHAPILFSESKLKRSSSYIYNLNANKSLAFNPNNIPTGQLKSNMLLAMSNATQNYMNKGIIQENSKLYSNISSINFSNQNIKLKRNKSQINIIENKNKDDIFKKFGTIVSIDKKRLYNEAEKEYKLYQKMEMSKLLIQKEGKYVYNSQNSSQPLLSNRYTKYYLGANIMDKVMGLPFNLEDEESRELKAITGYNKEYKKNLKYYFKCYSNETKKTITKSKFMKMLRDRGINNEKLDYEEINLIIRRLFKENLNEFHFNQFINLLVQTSYLIYTKRRPTLTIGETYGILLKRFSLNNNAEKIALLKKKYEAVIDYLLELKEEKEPFNMPEGFKFVQKTSVKYNSRLAPHFLDILGEGNFICYQVLEDILFHIFNSSIIEPYVEVSTEETVEIEPEKLHNWTPDLTMAYIDLDKEYKFEGIFAADAIEDGLRKILKKNKVEDIESESKDIVIKKHTKMNMSWARKGIKKKMEEYKKRKIEAKKKKTKIKIDIFHLSKEEKLKIQAKFEEVKKRREEKEEEKKNKIILEQQKKKEKEEQKLQSWIEYRKGRKIKLKEQFKTILTKRKEIIKIEEEKKEKEIKIEKEYKDKALSNKNKNYYVFEKNLNNTMKKLIAKEEIKQIFEKYESHLKLIYDIYSRIGYNKISFFSKEIIKIDEFKQFLINFTVLGVVISAEQMIWIFNNISKVLQKERNNQMYLNFEDFKLSLCYLAIFSRFEKKNKKILPKDIEETNGENIENFMKFLGLKLPFNKIDIEKFINERRSITMKNLLGIQNNLKKENKKEIIKNKKIENEKEHEQNEDNNNTNSNVKKNDNNKKKENNNNVSQKDKESKNSNIKNNNPKNTEKQNDIQTNNNNNSNNNNVNDNKNINTKISEKENIIKNDTIKNNNSQNVEKEKENNINQNKNIQNNSDKEKDNKNENDEENYEEVEEEEEIDEEYEEEEDEN